MDTDLPILEVLSTDDLRQVDHTARRILKHVGMKLRGGDVTDYLNRFRMDLQADKGVLTLEPK